jgi:Bacterial Ig domain
MVTASLSVTPVNDAPLANNDIVSGTEDVTLVISPVTNDTDIEGSTLIVSAFTSGTQGSVSASGKMLVYTPTTNACGTDSVTYRVSDGVAVSNTGTISIMLACVNDAPTAIADTVIATEDIPLAIAVLANDTDIENNTLSITSLTQPAGGGSVAVVGTGVVYTPTANACGATPITFTYQARDTLFALSAVTTVTISALTCVNDAPLSFPSSASVTGNIVISSGTTLSGGSLSGYLATNNSLTSVLTATDIDTSLLDFILVTPPLHGTVTLSSTGVFVYTPALGHVGSDIFMYRVSDGITTTAPVAVSLTVIDLRPPIVPTTPVSGPGGGGGSTQSFPTVSLVDPLELNSAPVRPVVASTGLVSQLLLSNRSLSGPTPPVASLLDSYTSLITPIRDRVIAAELDQISSIDRAMAIRQAGQSLMRSITRSLILSASQKSETLSTAQTDLVSLQSADVPSRESRALDYIIRLIKRERSKIESGVEFIRYVMSL